MYEFLKKIPFFAGMPEEDLNRLCEIIVEINLKAGEELFSEGSPGDKAYVIKEGQIEIFKIVGGRKVQLAIRQPGDVIGEMSMLETSTRNASGQALTDSKLLAISHEQLNHLLDTSPSAARAMVYTTAARLKTTELLLRDSEKMAQLGSLTAGIAHELNNPASATQRGADQLKKSLGFLQQAQLSLIQANLSQSQIESLLELDQHARQRSANPESLNSLNRSDREYEMEQWLESKGIEDAWEIAPILVNLGFQTEQLDLLDERFTSQQLPIIISWLGKTYSTYSLLEEISQGSSRITDIVKSLMSYSYLDQAPLQEIDLHESLDNTLVMLRSKLKQGVNVQRQYADDIPRILAYGSELNQVWTNIIDNAIQAMDGKGEITIRTNRDGDQVIVEIEDNGPGIPADIQSKIFSPFFTTKPVGKGTGLGLNITYNIVNKHKGDIKLFSRTGFTCFQVILPINFEKSQTGTNHTMKMHQADDEKLRNILTDYQNIAVVGITNYPERPSYSVPEYLQSQGYRIIPVNPKFDQILSEPAYEQISAVPDPIDVVLVFRRSEAVPEIVEQAVQAKAKVVWMQEGIINESAAQYARRAGLEVVMDTCMRTTHQRLMA
jgi:signal transduction histidine kinase/predicted CoA-binding protein